MEGSRTDNPLKIPEISAEEFRACVDQDDFLRRYGNPVVIHSGGQRDVVCMAREYYERLIQERDLFIEDENIKYWIYEFEATQEKKLELERSAAKCCMTPDEFFAAAIEDGLRKAETDSGGCNSQHQEQVLEQTAQGYPEERALDRVFFRVKRNDQWRNICFSDLTESERTEITKDRSIEWMTGLAFRLADVIRKIGDQFDITAKIPEEEEE